MGQPELLVVQQFSAMSAAGVQNTGNMPVPALMFLADEEASNETSFMDAMAVYMGMEVPKNKDPVAEAEAALAYLENMWLVCQVGRLS